MSHNNARFTSCVPLSPWQPMTLVRLFISLFSPISVCTNHVLLFISTRHSKANAKPETKNYSLCPHIPKGVLIDTGMSRFQLSLPKVERRRLKPTNRINWNPRVSPSSETALYLCKLSIRNVLWLRIKPQSLFHKIGISDLDLDNRQYFLSLYLLLVSLEQRDRRIQSLLSQQEKFWYSCPKT